MNRPRVYAHGFKLDPRFPGRFFELTRNHSENTVTGFQIRLLGRALAIDWLLKPTDYMVTGSETLIRLF